MTPVTISETVYPKKKRRVLERLSVTHVQTKSSKTLNISQQRLITKSFMLFAHQTVIKRPRLLEGRFTIPKHQYAQLLSLTTRYHLVAEC